MQAITTEMERMGGKISISGEEMTILPADLHPTEPVHTYNDHRIAMAFAPLRLLFPKLEIEKPEVVSKSFPEFWDEFDKVLNA
jgi:3-phosphoshikimate 1-carboxyvinyltransferase